MGSRLRHVEALGIRVQMGFGLRVCMGLEFRDINPNDAESNREEHGT